MEATKETAANIGASARSGMEKTKATVQAQVDKASAYKPSSEKEAAAVNKEAAKVKKQERVNAAEEEKQSAMRDNAAAKEQANAEKDDRSSEGATGTAQHGVVESHVEN